MPSPQAVFVGLTTLDVIQRVTSEPGWGRKGVSESSELVAGGPAANAAVAFAALMGSATLVTAVGVGGAADVARQDLERHGVHIVDCAPAGWDLPIATCIIAAHGERTVISPGATTSEARLNPRAREAVARADALLIDGHHPLMAREALSLTGGPALAKFIRNLGEELPAQAITIPASFISFISCAAPSAGPWPSVARSR